MKPDDVVGPYRILGKVGEGGMGEVYRARDTKLHRDVAVKVLPDLFARDPERLARFEREARTLAAVNHPYIAQVYGVEGTALVMEFVDGEDLAQRIAREGAIPLDEVIPIALQIAEAVAAAHEQGIIHRDLKPANIKVRDDGTVKVLDFGLAKALAAPDVRGSAPAPSIDNSPTITSPFQLSKLGVALGTAAYMAPEQAKGKPLDKRVDIWAFGCVLFEMVTGRKPFDGEDVTDVLAAIVRDQPNWTALPADTPAALRTLLRRCLQKDRRERLPDIGAARLELQELRSGSAPLPGPVPAGGVRPRSAVLPWALFALAVVTAIAMGVYAFAPRPAPPRAVYRSSIVPHTGLTGAPALRMKLSPDGRLFAYVAPDTNGRPMLWVRALDSLTERPVPGSAEAASPFWSPDGRWIAFFADGKLKKADLSSGAVISICDAVAAPPGTWNREDVILFTGAGSAIVRVPAAGGKPVEVTRMGEGQQTHIAPTFLPDGRHFIYTVSAASTREPGVFVASLDDARPVKLLDISTNTTYANGHLLFMRDTTLMAQPFDVRTRSLSGEAVPIAEGVQMNPATGTGAFSASDTGVLVYQTGAFAGTQLTWFDRTGQRIGIMGEPKGYRDVQLSPDGNTASVTITGPNAPGDIWLLDVQRKIPRRFTFNEVASSAVWTADGRAIVYAARRSAAVGPRDIYRKPVSGTGDAQLLHQDHLDKLPVAAAPDGSVLYRLAGSAASGELWILPAAGDRTPRPFEAGVRTYSTATVSPDGKWIAYSMLESRRREVFVSAFPSRAGKWQVSSDGGDTPVWRRDGKELFFTSNDRMMAVDVTTSGTQFEAGVPRPLFAVRVPAPGLGTRSTFAATPDGQRFLVNTWDATTTVTPITLLVNWPETVKK